MTPEHSARGSAISYWLKSEAAGDVRISISDVTGRELRSIAGTKTAGLNRVQWDLGTTPGGGRGRGQQPAQAGQPATPAGGGGGGGGGGRGFGGAPPVGPGTYLVKVTAGDKVLGQKTIVVEADSTFLQ